MKFVADSTASGTFQVSELTFFGDKTGEAAAAEPTYTYPASGESGNALVGTVIGNETGWGGNADAGAAAAFDGNPATFFDPLGQGDGYCGMDMGKKVVLDKVVILSRADWNARFKGAEIRGNNEDNVDTAVTLWKSDVEGTNPDYYVITDFENNDGYQYYFYYNTDNHGDVAEVEFYGSDAPAEEAPAEPGFGTADEAVASIGKTAITGVTANGGSEGFGGEGPDNLWDGDTATKFCTNSLPATAYGTLDGTYSIDGIAIALANDNSQYGRIPTAWTLYGSTDGENWTVIASGDDSLFEKADFRYFATSFDASAPVSEVKFEVTTSTDEIMQISEIVLTGAKADVVDTTSEELETKAEAPQTFDFGVIAAIASVISLAGFAVAKKKH